MTDVSLYLILCSMKLRNTDGYSTADRVAVRKGLSKLLLQLLADRFKVDRVHELARAAGDGLAPFEHLALQLFGEAAHGLAHDALEEADDGVGEVQLIRPLHQGLLGRGCFAP